MSKYSKTRPEDFLRELKEMVLGESLTIASRGGMLFSQDGVLITDDAENEYIPASNPPLVVETGYAVELSWLFFRIGDGLGEVALNLGRRAFFEALAETALQAISRGTDLTGLAMSLIAEAAILSAQDLRSGFQTIKDELLASAGSLSDLAEKID